MDLKPASGSLNLLTTGRGSLSPNIVVNPFQDGGVTLQSTELLYNTWACQRRGSTSPSLMCQEL